MLSCPIIFMALWSCRAKGGHGGPPLRWVTTLGDVIKSFKSYTTKQSGMSRLWQRNYFEHIIRNEDELNHCRRYMAANPSRWLS